MRLKISGSSNLALSVGGHGDGGAGGAGGDGGDGGD